MQTNLSELDISTILKATQALTSEIILDKLLKKFMKIIIENSGAQAGFLLLQSGDDLMIEGEINIDSGETIVRQSIPLNEVKNIAVGVVNYVARTHISVVLDDATKEGLFSSDAYIKEHNSKSVLCIPILRASKLVGILYLENNLTPGAFTPQRQETLNILAVQAAISLENAILYEELYDAYNEQKKVEEELTKSEEKYRLITENANDLISIIDSKFKFEFINEQAFKGLMRYSGEDLIGIRSTKFIHPDDLEGALKVLLKVFKEGWGKTTIRMKHKDGHYLWLEIHGRAFIDIEGRTKAIMISRDVTERRKAEEELKKHQDHLEELVKERTHELKEAKDLSESIINSLPGIFYLSNDKGELVRWNKNLEDISEYSYEEIFNMNPLEFFKGENKEIITKSIRDTLINGENNVEVDFTSKSDKTVPYYFTGVRTMIDDTPHIIGMGIDITERVQAEEKLEHTLYALKRSNEDLSRFAYAASHDLQEPLRTIISYTQLFTSRYKNLIDDKADKYVNFILDGTMRMRTLITDLLAYSRIETHGIHFKPTNCQDIIEDALSNLNASIKEKNAIINYDGLPTINGDPSHLTQLFQNLISNAIKFCTVNSPVIHISTKKVEHEWQFSVKDNGIGIDSKYFERIFVIFQRLHTRQEYPGTGIGLAICKKIVERHEGRIWVESEIGKGSTFYFTIPLIEYKNNQKI